MTQEDEDLLFNDICARIPYGIKIAEISDNTTNGAYEVMVANKETKVIGFNTPTCLIRCYRNMEMIKPYLRPMSSMTEEEYDDMFHQLYSAQEEFFRNCSNADTIGKIIANDMVRYDWLNKKMFDYRGLIPKNLAIEVTENNNPYK